MLKKEVIDELRADIDAIIMFTSDRWNKDYLIK